MSTLSKYIRTMALDDFKLWNYRTLKFYLPWRGKLTTLYSDVLAVR